MRRINFIQQRINTTNGNAEDVNGYFSMGIGGRIKITKRASLIFDYFYNFAKYYQKNDQATMPLSIGYEVETGGHVFSLFFTNADGCLSDTAMSSITVFPNPKLFLKSRQNLYIY